VSDLRLQLDAVVAVVRRDATMSISYRWQFFTQLISLLLGVVLFYFLSRLVKVESFSSTDAYYAYVVCGLAIIQVLNSTFHTVPTAIRQELVAGTFEGVVLSPFGAVRTIVATTIFPFGYSLLTAICMLAFAALAFGMHVQWNTAPLAIPVALLGAFAFVPFSLLTAASVLVAKQALSGMTWIVAILAMVAGLYFPVSLLPAWTRWLSDVQPVTPAVELLRHLLVGAPLAHPAWLDLIKLVAFGWLLALPAIWVLVRALEVARQRGTTTEY
jgi:ABC-2 type transport system permease protein